MQGAADAKYTTFNRATDRTNPVRIEKRREKDGKF